MHHSRLCAVLIDCKTADVDEAAHFWGEVLGRPVDPSHPGSRGNYRMLERWVVMQAPTDNIGVGVEVDDEALDNLACLGGALFNSI
jgi:hypothetical protein